MLVLKDRPLPSAVHNPLAGRRILIAEDESLIALELETALRDFGCEIVGPVARVEDVLRQVEAHDPDGALLDVNLRGQQIFVVLPHLVRRGLRLIITSGYDDATLFPTEFRDLPRIAKPFDEFTLRRMCERVFGRP
jgi:DNA-binding NtrC family response regulator